MQINAISTKSFIQEASSRKTKERYRQKRLSAIIPVFGIKAQVEKTLSILNDHPLVKEIIIVDDGSSSSDFGKLKELANSSKKTILAKHIRNRGFSAACNTGIALSEAKNDILLINSDSIVPSSSISLLTIHSCIQPLAATIGAISNANGFFSVNLSEKLARSLELGDDIVNKILLRISPVAHEEVVTNNGYVLYVTREALEKIGLFDGSIYGKGYGEESDFCLRASKAGLINICSFIACGFHYSASSFGSRKTELKKLNSAVIRAMYPEYLSDLGSYESVSGIRLLHMALSKAPISECENSCETPAELDYIFNFRS
jgi:GT2 family glycosyltransferase